MCRFPQVAGASGANGEYAAWSEGGIRHEVVRCAVGHTDRHKIPGTDLGALGKRKVNQTIVSGASAHSRSSFVFAATRSDQDFHRLPL